MPRKPVPPPTKITRSQKPPVSGKNKPVNKRTIAGKPTGSGPSNPARPPAPGGIGSTKRSQRPLSRPQLPAWIPKVRLPLPGPSGEPRPVSTGISLDRKLDILGIILALAGLLTLLSLLSPVNSSAIGTVVSGLVRGLGWGTYPFAIGLVLVGLWLVLRNFERIPPLVIERITGIGLLFINLLAWIQLSLRPENAEVSYAIAQAGQGGGYLGAVSLELLRAAFGLGGALVAMVAWMLIALAFALDVSVVELGAWIPPLLQRLSSIFARLRRKIFQGQLPEPGDPDFVPLAGGSARPPVSSVSQGQPGHSNPAAAPVFSGTSAPARVWDLPAIDQILDAGREVTYDDDLDRQRAILIEETLSSFGAPAKVVEINRGPTITQFGVEPDFVESRGGRTRVRVGKIAALADDLALALSAQTIRIQAPVPGKSYVGIEVPNDETAVVALRDVMESEAFKRLKTSLRFALGQDVAGNAVAADLSGMPHLLVAGATGSGKSVCVNALIACLLLNNTPDDLRLIMVDPKRVELTGYNGIPHLLAPVVVEMEKVVAALQWVTREMDMRYRKLAEAGTRNIQDYNARQLAHGERKLPYLVVIIDELADLMMLAPDETERTIARLAQLARATGIHLVIATQRPSVDVVTGVIKANFPARIAFAVASGIDSRVILDQPGAERLLGRGDMLFQAPDAPAALRLQGVFVSDGEIGRLVNYWLGAIGAPSGSTLAGGIPDALPPGVPLKQMPLWDGIDSEEDGDPLLNEAIDISRRQGRASISMLQRRLRIGYTRSARLVETMEAKGIVGPPEPGTGTREILDYGQAAPPAEEPGD